MERKRLSVDFSGSQDHVVAKDNLKSAGGFVSRGVTERKGRQENAWNTGGEGGRTQRT
jgi:hypothetical protein